MDTHIHVGSVLLNTQKRGSFMPKAGSKLVIVESPAKAKTIERYLGSEYKVVASMGHLRDLPKSKLGVDIENNFEPHYIPVKGRADVISDLRKRSKNADIVYLATDPDREGEAISWHLKELLNLEDEKAKRVTFNEITKKVVTDSIDKPRDIDIDLVNAQQTRRILDRIVGYKVSPLLWKTIRRGLSAGRVQSVATKMVVEREKEISDFVPQEYWNLDAALNCGTPDTAFTARYYGSNGRKKELHSEEEVNHVLSEIKGQPFLVESQKRSVKKRSPAPPFITSTLQQEASRRLGMTPRRTMSIAQQLYEGVAISGKGTTGLITYMRTDSLRLSQDALNAAAAFIHQRYGDDYYSGPRTYKTKAGAQDAHEAIRPTDVFLTPEEAKKDLNNDQYRLYRLIWERFTASQMANATYDNVATDIISAGHLFKSSYSELKFPGYTVLSADSREEDENAPKNPLPKLSKGQEVFLDRMIPDQQFTQPPSRYTEASLIRALEENGIGRPSTYAPIISNITTKEYVEKDGKYLKPTNLGVVVTDLMDERFSDIVDLKFTAHMEENLDEIENGTKEWHEVLTEFYDEFDRELKSAEEAMQGERIKVPDEVTEEKCEICGSNLVIKNGKFGKFLACPNYPTCTFTKPLVVETPGKCPKCDSRILKKKSRNGYTYYGCERGQDCGFMTWDVPTAELCPDCGKTLFKKNGRGRRKPMCENESCPSFVPLEDRAFRRRKSTASTKSETKKSSAGTRKSSK